MSNVIIGCDPGRTGFIVKLVNGSIVIVEPLPFKDDKLDIFTLYTMLSGMSDLIVIEKPFIKPGNKNKGLTTQLIDYGNLEAICRLCCPKVREVTPFSWKAKLKVPGGEDGKKVAVERAKQYFPDHNFFRTPRCKNEDHNMAEAALLAYYGLKY